MVLKRWFIVVMIIILLIEDYMKLDFDVSCGYLLF